MALNKRNSMICLCRFVSFVWLFYESYQWWATSSFSGNVLAALVTLLTAFAVKVENFSQPNSSTSQQMSVESGTGIQVGGNYTVTNGQNKAEPSDKNSQK